MLKKKIQKNKRHNRIKAKIKGTKDVPRLCVFRSNAHIYAQIIDDENAKTVLQASDFEISGLKKGEKETISINQGDNKEKQKQISGKILKAYKVGELIAKKSIEKKIKKVVFDRAGYKYHGRVMAVAEGARAKGLIF